MSLLRFHFLIMLACRQLELLPRSGQARHLCRPAFPFRTAGLQDRQDGQEFGIGCAETVGSQHRIKRLFPLLFLLLQLPGFLPYSLLFGSGHVQLMLEPFDGLIQHRLLFLQTGKIALQHLAGLFELVCCGNPLIELPKEFVHPALLFPHERDGIFRRFPQQGRQPGLLCQLGKIILRFLELVLKRPGILHSNEQTLLQARQPFPQGGTLLIRHREAPANIFHLLPVVGSRQALQEVGVFQRAAQRAGMSFLKRSTMLFQAGDTQGQHTFTFQARQRDLQCISQSLLLFQKSLALLVLFLPLLQLLPPAPHLGMVQENILQRFFNSL